MSCRLTPLRASTLCPRAARWLASWCVLVGVLFGLAESAPSANAAAPAERTFRIPAGDAATTLREFATQSGEQIVYLVDRVRGERTQAVSGRFGPKTALDLMLTGTALQVSADPSTGALVVGRRTNGNPAARPLAPPKSTAPAPDSLAAPDPVVRLSPFAVHDDKDRGYRASSTLAGTRLNSELRDLAASISVVTRDFLDDVNATDLTSLLVYTLGTEVGGYGGNFSDLSNPEAQGVFDDALGQPSPGTRIRGLIAADLTRNYFLTDIPLDGYNLERVEISRGANANLFGLGSPAGIINSGLIAASLSRPATSATVSAGSYGTTRGTLDHNHVLAPERLALRLATVFDRTRYRTDFAFNRKKGATLAGAYRPFPATALRVTSELGRNDSNRPEIRPPYDRFTWWWAAGQPVWDPAAPGGGAGRLLATPQPPFTATTVFSADGARQPLNYLTANWGGAAANEPILVYLDPARSTLGGLRLGNGATVDGVKSFAENSALNRTGTALVSSGLVGLNSRVLVEQNVVQAANPLRSLYNREPMLGDPRIFDFFHAMLAGPTKYEWADWEAHNLTLEQTFLDQRAGLELALDRQRIDNGFVSPLNYALNLDPNERLSDGSPNPNFLRPVTLGSGFKRVYSQDRTAGRLTGYYRFDLRHAVASPAWGNALGQHLLNGTYSQQTFFYEQLAGTLANSGLDWRAFESLPLPGTASSTARIAAVAHYLGDSVAGTRSPGEARVQGLSATQDPSGQETMTLLTHQRPISNSPEALTPWRTDTFSLLTNGRHDVRNTVRNAQRYSERLQQKTRSASLVLQSHWLDRNVVTTAGWRRDRVASYDAGLPAQTALGTADIRPDAFAPQLTRTLSESSASFGIVAHLPPPLRRRLDDLDASIFYNRATNFRIAPQRYTITGTSLPSETGRTHEYGVRVGAFHGKLDLRVTRYETRADHATVNGLAAGINQLAMLVGQVVDHNYLGDNRDNPAGIAAFEAWLESPNGQLYRRAFAVELSPITDASRPATQFGRYSDATGDRGQISGVSALKSTGYEIELTFNPTPRWRLSANAATAEAVRTDIAPELRAFLFGRDDGLVSLVQTSAGAPTEAGQLVGSPLGAATTSLQSFVAGNVLNLGLVSTFAQAGTRNDELRKWSFRAVTNYSFSDSALDGRLKGFAIGGAIRWADAPLLGYAGTMANAGGTLLPVSDISRPYYGPTETLGDAWISYTRTLRPKLGWKLQLNVRNLGVGNRLKPLAAWPDGTVVQWTIREPQRWTLTSTFTF